jgi:hypothetical protein
MLNLEKMHRSQVDYLKFQKNPKRKKKKNKTSTISMLKSSNCIQISKVIKFTKVKISKKKEFKLQNINHLLSCSSKEVDPRTNTPTAHQDEIP